MTKFAIQTLAVLAIIATLSQVVKTECSSIDNCNTCSDSSKCTSCEKGYGLAKGQGSCKKCPDTCVSCAEGTNEDGDTVLVCLQCKDSSKKPTADDPRCGATSLQSFSFFGLVALVFVVLRN